MSGDNVVNLRDGTDAIAAMLDTHSFSSEDNRLSRERPYCGQPWTFHGERGENRIEIVTLRDLGDAIHEALTEWDANPHAGKRGDWDLTAVVGAVLCSIERGEG